MTRHASASSLSLRRRIDEGGTTGAAVVVFAGVLLSLWAVVATAEGGGMVMPGVALAFGVFIAFGELARINLPGGREAAPLALAGALGYALVAVFANRPAEWSALQVVAVTAAATVVGLLPHVAAGRGPRLDAVCRRVLTVGLAAGLFRSTELDDVVRDAKGATAAVVVMVVVSLALLVDAALAAVVRASRDRAPFLPVAADEIRAQLGIGSAVGATAAIVALAAGTMGVWAFPVFVIPLLLTQFAFRRYASIRATYLQTVRSLSRVTEVGGYTETGHSRRVSELSLAVGRELGMSEAELLDLEYAALMHDIGQLALSEPIPGGATVVAAPTEQRRIAELGAEVIRQTEALDEVARIVELQSEPYRRPHDLDVQDVPLAARIIKAVNGYDDLVGDSASRTSQLEALERLRLGMAYEYDPRVVESLSNVVSRSLRSSL